MENYEINSNTLAILPISNDITKVIETDVEYIINRNSLDIIDHSCKYFGSSYLGRFEGTKSILNISYKAPILIEETKKIIFFPTSSPRKIDCMWISFNQIDKFLKNSFTSKVIFKNGYELNLDISIGSLENQIFRSTLLNSELLKRIK